MAYILWQKSLYKKNKCQYYTAFKKIYAFTKYEYIFQCFKYFNLNESQTADNICLFFQNRARERVEVKLSYRITICI